MEAASATRLSSENRGESSIRSPGLLLNSIKYCMNDHMLLKTEYWIAYYLLQIIIRNLNPSIKKYLDKIYSLTGSFSLSISALKKTKKTYNYDTRKKWAIQQLEIASVEEKWSSIGPSSVCIFKTLYNEENKHKCLGNRIRIFMQTLPAGGLLS